ncbi:MAG: hypothetical protein WCO19_03740 [Candidatus Saccharibacteria bacterium]
MITIGTLPLNTKEQFKELVDAVQNDPEYTEPEAFAIGIGKFA